MATAAYGGYEIWNKLQEIADIHNEGPRRGHEESSSASSSAAESDSIGSVRNSSPEISKPLDPHHILLRSKEHRLSPRCDFSKNLESRLSPSVYGGHLLAPKSVPHHATQLSDIGYHSMNNTSNNAVLRGSTPTSSIEARSSPDPWDVRATKIPAQDLKRQRNIVTRNIAAISPSYLHQHNQHHQHLHRPPSALANHRLSLDYLPDDLLIKILSFLSSNDIVRLSRVNRRFYFCAWDPSLWNAISLTGENTDADLGIKTILRLLSRNSAGNAKLSIVKIFLNGCRRLTDRGLAIVARRCPGLKELEIQYCINITNGGLMDLVSKCHLLDHLDVTGCQMISTISVHQPPPSPRTLVTNFPPQPQRRQLNIQYLDISDCVSLEDSGLKMIVESCPQLTYLFLRRCSNITDAGIKAVSSYCLCLRELSISDCIRVTDFSLYELAKLGPNLRYLSVAKCDRISDSGIKQLARLCYKLRYLNLRGCESISDSALEVISRSCTRLRSLDVGKCDITDGGLRLLAEHCPNLKKLSIKSCEMVGDKGIQTVAYYCRGLQQLNIQDSPVTLDGYRSVKKFCRRCVIEHSHPGFY
nr:F-box/LRR-repeat protein 7-like [Lepeophtheirus salmonis]